ncbi:DNA-3-methyladenine glycosylase [Telmatospirillum sp. J64-1]|uniref:DNA-3-methyladenine glycosylase family protein n=1 Tax=Telmatospirillum sp. J64-1 TaxID=2502183 RepID=UPI00115F4A25|nr:AlkA N-terminal domain-containing protein [Telmatospirillum sp. J64-1]
MRITVELPPGFRPNDILAFHRRDPLMLAERVDGDVLRKGLTWTGRPACLTIRLHPDQAEAELSVDGPPRDEDPAALEGMVRRMLGLTQRVEDFEATFRAHPQIGPLVARNAGLRVPLAATPFEALTWAISGQQISVGAALSLRRKLIQRAGLRHSSGLLCHPDAVHIAAMSEEDLRQASYSQAKARTLLALSQGVRDEALPLDRWLRHLPVEEIRAQLSLLRGIGPWTINYALLRGFGWLDGSLHGDVAVRRNLQALLGAPEKITQDQAEEWLSAFTPWRALIAAHLWAMQKDLNP